MTSNREGRGGFIVGNGLLGDQERYRRWGEAGPEWTPDRKEALRFARRSDAENFAAEDIDAWQIIFVEDEAVDFETLTRTLFDAMQDQIARLALPWEQRRDWDEPGDDAEKGREIFRAGVRALLAAAPTVARPDLVKLEIVSSGACGPDFRTENIYFKRLHPVEAGPFLTDYYAASTPLWSAEDRAAAAKEASKP
jgi:hypothetical protein